MSDDVSFSVTWTSIVEEVTGMTAAVTCSTYLIAPAHPHVLRAFVRPGMVMYHVYKDLGLRVEQPIQDGDALLLALWHKHKSSVL